MVDEHADDVIDLRQVAAGALRGNREPSDRSAVSRLLAMMAERGVSLFRTQDHACWASVPVDGHLEPVPIVEHGTAGLARWLYRTWHEATGSVPADKAVGAVVKLSLSQAEVAPVREVSLRVAERDGTVVIDLCRADHAVAVCTPDGWTVAPCPDGVLFRRPPGMREIPEPDPDGTLQPLWDLLAPRLSEEDCILLIGWLVGSWQPGRPYPVLQVLGEQGTGKSTLCRLVRMLCDPAGEDLGALDRLPDDEASMAALAKARHVCGFENISYIPAKVSDALAALSTGAGWAYRRLYTNDELCECFARRPVLLNGITNIVTRGDLLDRSVILSLSPIPDAERLTEEAFWGRATALRGQVAGGMLTAVCAALRHRASVPGPWPRMADFARWVQAAEPALPWAPGRFRSVYGEARQSNVATALDASPLTALLAELVREHKAWSGTSTELLELLGDLADESVTRSKSWPKDATRLSGELTRLAPALRAAGVADIQTAKRNGRRLVLIGGTLASEASVPVASLSDPQRPCSDPALAGLGSQIGGVRDARDANSSTLLPQAQEKERGGAEQGDAASLASLASPGRTWLPYQDDDDDPYARE